MSCENHQFYLLFFNEINSFYFIRARLPGTTKSELKVNGSIVIETNVFYKTYPYDKKKVNYPLSLKKDEVFLLCDYREGGRDSRYFGAVSKKEIKGKVITILRRSDL